MLSAVTAHQHFLELRPLDLPASQHSSCDSLLDSEHFTLQRTFQNHWPESPGGLFLLAEQLVFRGVKGLGMAVK